MKVSYNWLKKLVPIHNTPDELAELLTAAGVAVDEVSPSDGGDLCGVPDVTLTLDLTPNRSDCLSMLGLAYEVAALTNAEVVLPEVTKLEPTVSSTSSLKVEVEDDSLCPAYFGLVITNVIVADSPLWMQAALKSVGIRPVNNIVDITNYVMWELGQPLHAFDYDKIAGRTIRVRKSTGEEKVVTLDGVERTLPSGALVIADPECALAIAGVMGSSASEVSARTSTVVLESAHFDRTSIRRCSRSLGLATAASARFDKGIDPVGVTAALSRAAFLVAQLGIGVVSGPPVGRTNAFAASRSVPLAISKLNGLLATDLTSAQVANILTRLGFVVEGDGDLMVTVPARRRDVVEEIDLIEEVGRIYGFEHIPTTPLQGIVTEGQVSNTMNLMGCLRDRLLKLGLDEVLTMSFADPSFAERLALQATHQWASPLALQNPIARERSVMRSTLISGMLEVLEYNQARQTSGMAAFEIGRVFLAEGKDGEHLPEERLMLAFGAYGVRAGNWQTAAEKMDYFYVKGVLDALLPKAEVLPSAHPFLHPSRQASVIWQGEIVGFLGEVHPKVSARDRFVVCEIDIAKAFTMSAFAPMYTGLGKTLPVERDLAFLVPEEIEAAAIIATMMEAGRGLISSAVLFDVFTGPSLPLGMISMAFRLEIVPTSTLNVDSDVAALLTEIPRVLERAYAVKLRGLAQ